MTDENSKADAAHPVERDVMPAFTRGPWFINPDRWNPSIWTWGSERRGEDVFVDVYNPKAKRPIKNKHDVYLFKAAPKMYDLLATIENDAGQVPEWLWNKIQECLAEARGEGLGEQA